MKKCGVKGNPIEKCGVKGRPIEKMWRNPKIPRRICHPKPRCVGGVVGVVVGVDVARIESRLCRQKCGVKGNPIEKMWRKGKSYRKNVALREIL